MNRYIIGLFFSVSFLIPALSSAATLTVGSGKMFALPSQAIAAAASGDTIAIDAGTYTDDFATIWTNNLTLRGIGGRARLVQSASGVIPNGKAIWTVDGN